MLAPIEPVAPNSGDAAFGEGGRVLPNVPEWNCIHFITTLADRAPAHRARRA